MLKFINDIKKNRIFKIYNKMRQVYLKKFICNMGKIVEKDDKIICYVDQKSIDKYKVENKPCRLRLYGMEQISEKEKEIVDFFGLNKPVYYIFNGIDFNNTVEVFSPCANIIFKNCNFNLHIYINIGNEITFENNKYKDAVSDSINKKFFSARSVNKLTFIDDNFTNSCEFKNFADPCFGIKINNANEVNFINTKVDAEYPGTVDIKAKRTKMKKSEINSPEIYIDSQSFEFEDSKLTAQNGVIIVNDNCDFSGNIQSPVVFYNGTDLSTHNVNNDETTLKEARKKLVDELRNLSDYCQQLNSDKIQTIKDEFNDQTISKILKQK